MRRVRTHAPGARFGAALAVLALGVAACTGSTSGSGSGSGGGSSSGPAPGSSGDSITAMLALLPPLDAGSLGVVTVTRWAAAAGAYGIAAPEPGAADDAVLSYLSTLTTGDGGLISQSDLMSLQFAASRSTDEEFGYGRQSIAAEGTAGTAPRIVQAARGDFDRGDITAATKAGPVAEDVEETDVDDVPVLRWREDFTVDLKQITALSKVGSAGRLTVPDDSTLLYTTYDEGITDLIAAQQGGPSLADDDDLAAVAAELDAQDALSTQLTYRPEGSNLPYTAAGIGLGWDGSGRIVIVYSTPSTADAATVAERIDTLVTSGITRASNRPWSELLGNPDVRANGSTVVATFDAPAGRGSIWAGFLQFRENLF